jgi:uncharacterized delta-60 repeat protein
MKHFVYSLIALLQIGFLCNAQVGFNRVGYDTSVGQAIVSSAYQAVAVDSKNRIVTVGGVTEGLDVNGAIVRYNQDGTLDKSFNAPLGYFIIEGGTDSDTYYSVAIDSLNRIIVVGNTDGNDNKGLIARYKENGTLDTTFNGGFVVIDSQGLDYCYDLVIDSLDRIIVAGNSTNGNVGFVRRYLSTGALESTFNIGASGVLEFYGITIDNQNRVIAVGKKNNFNAIVVRFTSAGVLDTSFNGTGYNNIINDASYLSVRADSQGRVIVVGIDNQNGGIISRYKENGILDATFDATESINQTNSARYSDLIIDSYDRPLIVGETDTDPAEGLILRLTENGQFDKTFNKTGFVKTSSGPAVQSYIGIASALDNKIIVVGQTGIQFIAIVARYLSNGILDAESNWNLQNFRENINNATIGLLG